MNYMLQMKQTTVLTVTLAAFFCCSAQNPVNAFAEVTAVSGNTLLTLGSVNETWHSFEDGNMIIVMQMQDSVIGTFTTNVASFGSIDNILSAGLFEVAQILSHTESGSVPTSISLSAPLSNTYRTGTHSRVQVITFRDLGANYTTTAAIGTSAWNGTLGGVTAVSASSVLTLAHSISANAAGFRGGVKNTPNGFTACDAATYINALATRYAGKGEGIYRNTNSAFAAARGAIANGGGGGNDVNAGGGGGGNYLSGGVGGSGWTGAGTGCNPIAGGLPGVSLSTYISGSRIFMGGGGGGGHENDNVGTVGAAGGGIVIVKAGTLTTSSCAGISISANGASASNASNDGAGGGGAAGTVIFSVNQFSISGSCTVAVTANGGNGGNSNAGSGGAHGGGGGGAQGAVIYPATQPTTNITTSATPGTGGVTCGGCGASVNGASGTGPSNSGIVPNASGPLPVELLSFQVLTGEDQSLVRITWKTAVEKDARSFVIQRRDTQGRLLDLSEIAPKGSYSDYMSEDRLPTGGLYYYRLRLLETNGTEKAWPWVAVNNATEPVEPLLLPNPLPVGHRLQVFWPGNENKVVVQIFDPAGRAVRAAQLGPVRPGDYEWEIPELSPGVYTVRIERGPENFYRKLVIAE